jgi:phosphoglycolate phosphatase
VKEIIFDFDGTIADTFDVVLSISNCLAGEFGYPPVRPEEVKHLKNLTSREILKQSGVSLLKLPFLLRRLRVELHREICRLSPIAGIREVLQELRDKGNHLGIVTSNSRENVIAFLDAQEMGDLFDFVGSGLTLFGKGRIIQQIIKEQKLDPAIVTYVGDETRDIEAARKIGIRIIAVSWGFNSSQVLAEHHPDFLIHQPAELLEVLAKA